MAEFPALPLWTDAYLADTTHLSATEHGAFLLLLMTAWRTKTCTLPDDDKRLARFTRLTTGQWKRIRPVMEEFFTIKNGEWSNARLLDEREAVKRNVQQRSDAGKSSALKRKNRDATGVERDANENPTPIPITTPTEDTSPSERAAEPPTEDLKARIFGRGLDWLEANTDKPKAKLRPLVGKWCKDFGDGAVLQAFIDASRATPPDPVAWITKVLGNRQRDGPVTESGLPNQLHQLHDEFEQEMSLGHQH